MEKIFIITFKLNKGNIYLNKLKNKLSVIKQLKIPYNP